MKRVEKLNKLTDYLRKLELNGIKAVLTVEQADATSYLSSASGRQLLFARPEQSQYGNSDNYKTKISTIAFLLEKGLGPARTREKEDKQYTDLLNLSSLLLEQISSDITFPGCNSLSGFNLISVEIIPEISIFGGWMGYSIAMDFE